MAIPETQNAVLTSITVTRNVDNTTLDGVVRYYKTADPTVFYEVPFNEVSADDIPVAVREILSDESIRTQAPMLEAP